MGLMEDTAPLIITPHPVTLDGQRTLVAQLQQGERLGAFLSRSIPGYEGDLWEVRINGVVVPHQVMDRVRPKGGAVIEVRGVVKKTALMIVALVALTIFTAGVGTAIVAAGYSAAVAGFAQAAIYAAGSLLINKVLGPKRPKPTESDAGAVYSLGASRNQARPYQPLPLLLGGPLRIAPDVASNPYSWYEADDQYMAMTLTPGINVGRVEALYNGDALLSSYEGVTVWHNGFSELPNQDIPLYSNADTINGGALEAEKGEASPWVQRTSSANTIRLKVDVDFMLFDTTSKGKPKDNRETIDVQYRAVGSGNWQFFGSYDITSRSQKQQRRSYSKDVPEGQYDVRVRIAGRNTDGSGATSDFTWSTLTSIQKDTADYAGLSRIGIRIKATGQLNGQLDEVRCVAYPTPAPVWTESGWATEETNNPGAVILAYARGFRDQNGKLIAGIGLDDVQIDVEALKAFMLFCRDRGYSYAHYLKDVRNHDDVLNAVALAGFGQISWAGGRLSVAWAGDEQPLSGVVNMATIKKGQFQVDYTLANAADGIEYSYYDATDWTTKTLRVAAPGVTTMLNPATVEGEGITSEAHAAQMARYHLAQSLYQYKDISYSTDIEHLSYRRMSVLALQHDLTQWGFGGRIVAATAVNGVVTLKLDEPVPAPSNTNAWVGLRIPGERVYRVFGVRAFTGPSDTIVLAGTWPGDAPLPGNTADNPAHDTIWIYDFKQTPGYRVRVVGIEPESDLKGAKVSVVPEPPEFWNYVLTGQYVPPASTNPTTSRPIASGLVVSEQQIVQGDTVFTELTVTFDITGPVGNIVVLAAGSDGVLAEVAQTTTRTATWRISQADQYTVVVRPFSPEGQVGVSASATYITAGADVPPLLADFFDVDELPGGVRMFSWGFLSESIQSPDFAGVEVRYIEGLVAQPDWAIMTPIGEGGYHTAPFEAVIPKAGNWTFACRSRNTSGELSTGMRVVAKALGQNLGEQMAESYAEAERTNQRITQEILDRVSEDLRVANEAVAAARAYTDAQVAALNGILEDIVGADDWVPGGEYPAGDFVRHGGVMFRALADNSAVEPGTNPAVWQEIGDYTSVGDALAAAISMSTQNASDLRAEAGRLDALLVRMPAGTGSLATAASVAEQVQLVANSVAAVAQRTATLEAALPGLATNAYVRQLDEAQTNVAMALGRRIDQTNAVLAGKAEAGTVQTIQSKVDALDGKVSAQAAAITQVSSKLAGTPNMLKDSSYARGFSYWTAPLGSAIYFEPKFGNYLAVNGIQGGTASEQRVDTGAGIYVLSAEVYRNSAAGNVRVEVGAFSAQGFIGSTTALSDPTKIGQWQQVFVAINAPAGTTYLNCRIIFESTNTINSVRRMKLELGLTPTLWTDDTAVQLSATATQILETRATQLENGQTRLEAKAGVLLDVNGRVIGWRANNDGAQGIFDVVADRFNVTDPNGTGSTTFEAGRWVTRSGGYMQVHGKPFGTTGDLMMYLGVGSDPNAASKSTGIFWIDNKGNAYFGGSLSAGVLRNAVQTGTTQTIGTELVNGPFRTNGNNRTVTLSFTRTHRRQRSAAGSTGFVAGAGANTAQVQLFRQIGTGAWVLWQVLSVTGSVDINNEPDGPDIAISGWGGSFTVNDSSSPLENVAYRAVVTAFTEQSVTHQTGNFDLQTITQNLSIISVEQ